MSVLVCACVCVCGGGGGMSVCVCACMCVRVCIQSVFWSEIMLFIFCFDRFCFVLHFIIILLLKFSFCSVRLWYWPFHKTLWSKSFHAYCTIELVCINYNYHCIKRSPFSFIYIYIYVKHKSLVRCYCVPWIPYLYVFCFSPIFWTVVGCFFPFRFKGAWSSMFAFWKEQQNLMLRRLVRPLYFCPLIMIELKTLSTLHSVRDLTNLVLLK